MILTHLGVNKIIHPEEDMGVRVAQSLSYPMVSRYMGLEDNHFIVKIEIKDSIKGERFHHLMNMHPRLKPFYINGKKFYFNIDPNLVLQVGDILVVEGELEPLRKLYARFK